MFNENINLVGEQVLSVRTKKDKEDYSRSPPVLIQKVSSDNNPIIGTLT